ncbi:hypothetical protein ESA94_08660 [Lacibacter luteus]|uniref:Uncharacterized protein n=1 Tax=Lacibacter luteus TaxID=2508719 RepID=A0A4Q1CIT2_9BACT|nr:hypothetical protein [Lacibacter luteus]RXK60530.1 hypothetical protein ESA94_08660 [Lacibacter luteus]
MAIKMTYQVDKGFSFADKVILWGADRQLTRKLLNGDFNAGDNVIDLSQYNNGDTSKNIIQRRDIYENYQEQDNYFFLNFNSNGKLTELELHHGFTINIEGIEIDFSMNIEKVVELLSSISDNKKQLSDGEYFFKKLKLTIASNEAIGGDGPGFAYFYCSKDVTHLIDN